MGSVTGRFSGGTSVSRAKSVTFWHEDQLDFGLASVAQLNVIATKKEAA